MLFVILLFLGEPQHYGAPIQKETQLVTLEELMSRPETFVGRMVKLEGSVHAVCPMAGCWLDLKVADQKIRVKVKDGEIVFDQDLVGKKVLAEGAVYKMDLSREEAVGYYRHLAEEKGETFDPASVTGPVTLYQIGGKGVEVKTEGD